MKHCVIAVNNNGQHLSIICCYESISSVVLALRTQHNSLSKAIQLIAKGDLKRLETNHIDSFYCEGGYFWNESAPLVHDDIGSLIAYSESIDAQHIHIFQEDCWDMFTIDNTSSMQAIA